MGLYGLNLRLAFRRLLPDRRGALALEFAILATPFFFLVCGVVELGLIMSAEVTLDNAVAVAARQVEIGSITTSAAFTSAVCNSASTFLPSCATKLQVHAGAGTAFSSIAVATVSSDTLSTTSFSAGSAGSDVLIQVLYPRALMFSMITSGIGLTTTDILSTVAVKNEPYS